MIDFHTHCFDEKIAKAAIDRLAQCANLVPLHDGTLQGLALYEKTQGVKHFVILPIATNPAQVEKINYWAATVNHSIPGCHSFATLHPEHQAIAAQLDFCIANNLRGIKMHPEYQNFNVDDTNIFHIYEEIFSRNLTLILHAGEDLGFAPPFHSSPKAIAKILDTFPKAKIIAAHLGGFRMWDQVEQYLVGRDIFLDTSFLYGYIQEQQLSRIIKNHGSHRILFGSDSPWSSPSDTARLINHINPPGKDDIFLNNAARLLEGR